jgi:hypothetical protein
MHNVHIEHLCCDLTTGFGFKWKLFFQGLKMNDGLNSDRDDHIWLIHHLFLPCINSDALEWAEVWNNHPIAMRDACQRSPKHMFLFGMVEDGPRGLPMFKEPIDEYMEDFSSYGVDWEDIDNPHIVGHHNIHNAPDISGHNPFLNLHTPARAF